MDYSLSGTGQSPFGAAIAAPVRNGPDLEEIQTDALGFLSLSGEAKVQLLPSSWPADNLPPPTASLLSVASQKGLVAAAGPNAVIVATTESVRKAFEGPKTGDNEIRPFQPQLTLPMPMRISQVTFTADENFLVLSAEVGGGLAVYDVQALLNGSTQAAFEMSTNSSSLRALVSNPTPEKGELLAVVTTGGDLMMANLKEKSFVSGANGQILKDRVSCVSWSTKGKQLVAGLGNGSAYQMTPEGQGKAEIPRPPSVDSNHHVSSITWLENNVFFVVHTPSIDTGSAPSSIFHVVTRQPPSEYTFQKIGDPTTPFGLNRSPPHHFLIRLRDFPPSLQDLLIVASSASTDIGLFTRSKSPLVSGGVADRITGVFTMTEMSDDSRRAQLPMTEDMTDTSPIGVGLDLSSRDKVTKPIAGDEIEESLTPVPALMVVNNEGILSSWWIIYTESIRQGTSYPGLVTVAGAQQSTQEAPTQQNPPFGGTVAKMSFGQSSFGGTPSGLTTSMSAFGATSGLGKTSSPWGIPATSTIASSAPTFGTSSIGSAATSTTQGVSFGSSAFPGSRSSPWTTGSTKPSIVAFSQPVGLGIGGPPFGVSSGLSASNIIVSSGGFASFASQSGFAAATASQANTGSIFGSKQQASGSIAPGTTATTSQIGTGSIYGPKPQTDGFMVPSTGSATSLVDTGSIIGSKLQAGGSIALSTGSSVGTGFSFGSTGLKNSEKPMSLLGSAGFKLGSTFKPAKDDDSKPPNGGTSFFGSNFGTALSETQKVTKLATPDLNEADMNAEELTPLLQFGAKEPGFLNKQIDSSSHQVTASTTPMSTPAAPKFQFPNPVPPVKGGLFGTSVESSTTNAGMANPISLSTGTQVVATRNKSEEPPALKSTPILQFSSIPETPKIKQEPQPDKSESTITEIPEAPLPPDPMSKTSYAVGESSVSSTEPDAPLPPDFLPRRLSKTETSKDSPTEIKNKGSISSNLVPLSNVLSIPDEGEDSDFVTEDGDSHSNSQSDEESGDDIAKDVSPVSDSQQTPGLTPQSSFGVTHRVVESNIFTKISRPAQDPKPRSLFGEIGGRTAPKLPPPAKQLSPRSPSPVRTNIPSRLRPEASRSVSAPGIASQMLDSQRLSINKPPHTPSSTFAISLEQKKLEDKRQAETKARKEAEESQALIDEEDDSIQKFLQRDIIGSKMLDDFIAHQDYVSNTDKDSIPAQVETVYRDINSMIDTLGINSCALKSFIKGHTEQYKRPYRTRDDLEEDDEWCLVEIGSLCNIVKGELTGELNHGQVKGVIDKLQVCADLERDLVKLRAKHDNIKALLTSRSDYDRLIITRTLPLTAEQATLQYDLRKEFTNFRRLLTEAEEGLTLLRAKLVSQTIVNRRMAAGPTVEAVVKTITKMTTMAEKRSGDIDVLENLMRKLRFNSTITSGSREEFPFTTPAKPSASNPGTSSTYSLFYTPDSVKDNPRGIHASLRSSTHSYRHGTSPRKKMSGFTYEEKLRVKAYATRKKGVADKLNTALQKYGTRILLMDDE